MFADRVIEAQLTFLNQQRNSRGNKLLADRGDPVDGFRCGRDPKLDIRQAVARDLGDLAILEHDQRKARYILAFHLGLDQVVYLISARNDRCGK